MKNVERINYRAAARLLGIPVGTLYCLVSQNRVPHIRLSKRLVRFDPEQLRKWEASHTRHSAEAEKIARAKQRGRHGI